MGDEYKFFIFDDALCQPEPPRDGGSATVSPTVQQSPRREPAGPQREASPTPAARPNRKPFSAEEDDAIRQLVRGFRDGKVNWQLAAEQFNQQFAARGSRRTDQLYQRWHRVLDPAIKKGPWTREEDLQIVRLLNQSGCASYSQIAASMSGRSGSQVRYRVQLRKDQWLRDGLLARRM